MVVFLGDYETRTILSRSWSTAWPSFTTTLDVKCGSNVRQISTLLRCPTFHLQIMCGHAVSVVFSLATRFEATATKAKATGIGRMAEFFSRCATSAVGSVTSRTLHRRQNNETKNNYNAEKSKDGDGENHTFPTRTKALYSKGRGVIPKEMAHDRQPRITKINSVLPLQELSELPTDLP